MINRRTLALFGAIALASAAAACSTRVDQPLGPSTLKHTTTSGDDDDDSKSTAADSTPATSTGATNTTTPAPATTTTPAAPPVDPFAGAPAFATITPGLDSSQQHLGSSNAGKDCLSCHGVPDDGAPTFSLAGTVHLTAGSTDGATGVQVRIVAPDGTEVASVGTDSVGNFWLLGTAQIPAGSHVGVRNGTTEQKMSGAIANGSCNTAGCHDPTRPLFIGN